MATDSGYHFVGKATGMVMRELPRNVDADAVIEIGRYLDDQAKLAPISLSQAIEAVRKLVETKLTDFDLEELILESAAARRLALLLDTYRDRR
ncbi:hypothetical protein [Mesorhizobium sp. ES1-4]|uniref:hypothetical protein n=1 Tax=Mesorhizobium sp. ES1-4 TaxID=2876627 RepID=UPI001CCC913B|nr:hypothetical protein [Mesorhizobium sp. ES1-4]MBZ9797732.1 hypothetical protein [Mesorhizobium sp. ES1-4]